MFAAILSSLGLSLSAGLNAWLPLLILALAARFTDRMALHDPFSFISSAPGLIVILLLLPIELFIDKLPRIDHISDMAHTAIRPLAGAILAAAVADASQDFNVWLGALLGLVAAGGVHAVKMSVRPVITAATGGVGNPVASITEDMAAAVCSVVAVVLPMLLLIVVPLTGGALWAVWKRLRRGSSRLRAMASRSA